MAQRAAQTVQVGGWVDLGRQQVQARVAAPVGGWARLLGLVLIRVDKCYLQLLLPKTLSVSLVTGSPQQQQHQLSVRNGSASQEHSTGDGPEEQRRTAAQQQQQQVWASRPGEGGGAEAQDVEQLGRRARHSLVQYLFQASEGGGGWHVYKPAQRSAS